MYIIERKYPDNDENWREIGQWEYFGFAVHMLKWYRKHTSGEYRVISTDPQRDNRQ